jgi:hypothetical protein
VVLAFRNGPIEDVHAGKPCPTCDGDPEYSHITQEEMRRIMKTAVDRIYTMLLMKLRRRSRLRGTACEGRTLHNRVG